MAVIRWGSWSWPRRGPGSSDRDHFVREPIWLGGGSRAGVEITRETAWQTSALLCGARVISQGVAQVPLKLYEEMNENGRSTRQPAREHPAYRLLADQPNDFQTSFSFRETLTLHAVIDGNGYAFINRNRDGIPRELLPIAPDDIAALWDDEARELVYEFGHGEGRQRFRPRDILHLHGPSWTGYSGLSALCLAREAIGLSAAMERGHAELYSKGGRPSGVLTTGDKLTPEAATRVRDRWQERFGSNGDGGVAVLDGDWKFSPMTMSAVDAQYVEVRRLQIEEIARFLMVFPQMLMQADKTATYASAEQFFLAHKVHSLDPWTQRWEQELKKSLIGYAGNNANIYPRFSMEGMLRSASRDRAEFYKAALGSGGSPAWMTPNEVRELENMNPMDGGDALPVATNPAMPAVEEAEETEDAA
jgi:HK97 family phage portal protein